MWKKKKRLEREREGGEKVRREEKEVKTERKRERGRRRGGI